MPHYRQFGSIFEAGAEWDRISAIPRTVAAMLFFQYNNGSFGGGPYWVWSSDEGEARHIAKGMHQVRGLSVEDYGRHVMMRNAFANWRAAVHQGHAGYRPEGHAEEFLVHDFPGCLGIVGAGNVQRAFISISWSPCIGGLDAKASTNVGAAVGCYAKLNLLAARYRGLQFEVSFKVPFGHFSASGNDAATYMNNNRLTPNIAYEYAPETG